MRQIKEVKISFWQCHGLTGSFFPTFLFSRVQPIYNKHPSIAARQRANAAFDARAMSIENPNSHLSIISLPTWIEAWYRCGERDPGIEEFECSPAWASAAPVPLPSPPPPRTTLAFWRRIRFFADDKSYYEVPIRRVQSERSDIYQVFKYRFFIYADHPLYANSLAQYYYKLTQRKHITGTQSVINLLCTRSFGFNQSDYIRNYYLIARANSSI